MQVYSANTFRPRKSKRGYTNYQKSGLGDRWLINSLVASMPIDPGKGPSRGSLVKCQVLPEDGTTWTVWALVLHWDGPTIQLGLVTNAPMNHDAQFFNTKDEAKAMRMLKGIPLDDRLNSHIFVRRIHIPKGELDGRNSRS